MTLFRKRYRMGSARMPGWDYRSQGHYFITVCTRDREAFFGEVADGAMALSSIGKVVAAEWNGIAVRRRNVELDEWVVMPNHMHGIVVLKGEPPVETPHRPRDGEKPSDGSSATQRPPVKEIQRGVSTPSRLLPGSLGAIIGQFKSRSTKRIWSIGRRDFSWQASFYDHIVRDEQSLLQIRQYIVDNPQKWELDKDNVENLYM